MGVKVSEVSFAWVLLLTVARFFLLGLVYAHVNNNTAKLVGNVARKISSKRGALVVGQFSGQSNFYFMRRA